MKLFFGGLLSIAIALAFYFSLTSGAGDSPVSNPVNAHVSHPALQVEVPARRAVSDAEPGLLSAGTGSEKRAETQQKEIATLRKEVALLRGEVSALQHQVDQQGRAAEEDPATDPRTDPAAQAAAEKERQEQMAVLEANFRQEPIDQRWAFEAEGAVQQALANDETLQIALRSIECHSQTCRMEIADDDTGELTKAMPLFLHQLAQTLPRAIVNHVDDGAGGATRILYMSRESNELP